jgi:hypothetical protein
MGRMRFPWRRLTTGLFFFEGSNDPDLPASDADGIMDADAGLFVNTTSGTLKIRFFSSSCRAHTSCRCLNSALICEAQLLPDTSSFTP